jgi:hypothetical protein
MAPQPSNPQLPTFFNVNGVVGAAPAANQREDVLLVQYLLKTIGMLGDNSPVFAACKAVSVTGVIDPKTITAITLYQQARKAKNPGVVVDGRVSPAKAGYSYGGSTWTIVHMNEVVRERYQDLWPRIDKIPGCPDEVKAIVKRTVVGV